MSNENIDTPSSAPRSFSSWAARLGRLLAEQGWTMATAESCTGGTIASMMTAIAGSSAYFKGGVVSYAVSVKEDVLGVRVDDNVVSRSVAEQMACGVARLMQADCAVSTTGLAGPGGGTEDCPVGTVWMTAFFRGKTESRCCHFSGTREEVILQASDVALHLLWQIISEVKRKNN